MPTDNLQCDQLPHRHVARRSGELYLKTAQILIDFMDLDLVSGVIFLTVSRLNLARALRDRAFAAEYAGFDRLPPDSSRDPVSVYSLAKEVGLPYETTRRHANKLVKHGLCSRVDGGMIVCQTFLQSELARRMSRQTLEIVTEFVRDVGAAGLVVPPAVPRLPDVGHHVARLNLRHFLATTDHLSKGMGLDLAAGLVLMSIIMANTKPLRENQELSLQFGRLEDVPPDDQRVPVSVYAVSKALRMPYETTRRYVAALVEAGLCQKMPRGGVIAPNQAQQKPGFSEFLGSNRSDVLLLLEGLAAVGISAATT